MKPMKKTTTLKAISLCSWACCSLIPVSDSVDVVVGVGVTTGSTYFSFSSV